MKRRILTGFAIIVLAIAMVAGCSGSGASSGGGGGKDQVTLDTGVNITVSNNPSSIPSFDASKGYSAVSNATEAQEIYEGFSEILFSTLDFDDIPFSVKMFRTLASLKSSASNRAIQTEKIQFNLADMYGDEIPNTKFGGYVDATVSMNDNEENPYPISATGTSKFRLDFLPGYEEEGYDVLGSIAGSGTLSNVVIRSEESMSGSASGSLNYAVNVADKSSKQWVKCIATLSLTTNLGAQTATIKMTTKLYGTGTNYLVNQDDTIVVKSDGSVTLNGQPMDF